MLLIVACVINYLLYFFDYSSDWGYYYADEIWEGAYWAYITSCFVHSDIIHLIFNIYWLFMLGDTLETEIGSLKLLIIVIATAIITSGFQFLFSEDTGCGFSGVLYCFVGLMWGLKKKYPSFQVLLSKQLYISFLVWLVLCWILTLTDVWSMGNAAHISGLVLGIVLSKLFLHRMYLLWFVTII